jgi:hypothetical protein
MYKYYDDKSSLSTPSMTDTDMSTVDSIDEHDFAYKKLGSSSKAATKSAYPAPLSTIMSTPSLQEPSPLPSPSSSPSHSHSQPTPQPAGPRSAQYAYARPPVDSPTIAGPSRPYFQPTYSPPYPPSLPSAPQTPNNHIPFQDDTITTVLNTPPPSAAASSRSTSHGKQPVIVLADPPAPAAVPRHAKRRSRGPIHSIRQSLHEAVRPPPRWYESSQNMRFRFVLTPRRKAVALPDPDLNPSGGGGGGGGHHASAPPTTTSSGAAAAPESGPTTSSNPPGKAKPGAGPSAQGVTLSDLSDDPTELQRLLTCALFMMNSVPDKGAPPKRLDLGVLGSRTSGSRHFAMTHESRAGAGLGSSTGSGSGSGPSRFKAPPADEHGNILDGSSGSVPAAAGGGTSKRVMWKITVQ